MDATGGAGIPTDDHAPQTVQVIERLELPKLPPSIRATRLSSSSVPPPPRRSAPVSERRSPQASANPVQLLGPIAVVRSTSPTARRAIAFLAVVILGATIATGVIIGRAIENTTIVSNLDRGDCVEDYFQNGADGEYIEIFLVQTTACSEPHAMEVFAVTELLWASDQYPGLDESFATGQDWCFGQYDQFVGGDYDLSPHNVWTFVPIEQSWAGGDRTVHCLVGQNDEVTLTTGTLERADR